jgi:GTP cyclohydrolase I
VFVLVPTDQLSPEGAAVLVEAKHMAEGPDAPLHLTSAAHGVFAEPNSTRATVLPLGYLRVLTLV